MPLKLTYSFVILFITFMQPVIGDDLRVLPEEINGIKTENMMHVYLEDQAKVCFDGWKQGFESLKTEEQIYGYHPGCGLREPLPLHGS